MKGARFIAAGAGLVLAGEWSHRLIYRRQERPRQGDGPEVIVVLGYPARRDGGLHPIQRWRCEIAVRSIDPRRPTTLVFTGAARDGRPSEAAVMARWAKNLGVGAAEVVLEEQAHSTWQNVEKTMGYMAGAETIKLASDPLHARRATTYLRQMAPDLAQRLAPAESYRPLEHPLLKLAVAVYEGLAVVRSVVRS
jgi:DUF218 domain